MDTAPPSPTQHRTAADQFRAPTIAQDPYPLDPDYERQLVRVLIEDATQYQRLAAFLEDNAFRIDESRVVMATMRDHFSQTKRGVGGKALMAQLVDSRCHEQGKLSYEMKGDTKTFLDEIFAAIRQPNIIEPFVEIVKRRHAGRVMEQGIMKFATRGDMMEVAKELVALEDMSKGRAPVKLAPLSQTTAKPMEWLMHRIIAKNRYNDVSAAGGSGKSTIISDLVTRLSRGGPLWDERRCEPVRTLWVASEELADEDLRPRFELMGADLDNIIAVRAQELGINLQRPQDVEQLRDIIQEYDIDLVVLDPFYSLTGDLKLDSTEAVRPVLDAVSQLAQDEQVTIIGIRHWRKAAGSATDRAQNSKAFTDAARVALVVVDDPKTGEIVLGVSKGNRAKVGFTYRFAKVTHEEHDMITVELAGTRDLGREGLDALCDPKKFEKVEKNAGLKAAIREAFMGRDRLSTDQLYELVCERVGGFKPTNARHRKEIREAVVDMGGSVKREGRPPHQTQWWRLSAGGENQEGGYTNLCNSLVPVGETLPTATDSTGCTPYSLDPVGETAFCPQEPEKHTSRVPPSPATVREVHAAGMGTGLTPEELPAVLEAVTSPTPGRRGSRRGAA